jgi:hypothetical protein
LACGLDGVAADGAGGVCGHGLGGCVLDRQGACSWGVSGLGRRCGWRFGRWLD